MAFSLWLMSSSYRDLDVWKLSMELVEDLYKASKKFPVKEQFGLTSQILRCGVSIPSNIAEGKYRSSDLEFARFLNTAYGSGGELETQLEIARRVNILDEITYFQLIKKLDKVMRMLNSLIRKIRKANSQ